MKFEEFRQMVDAGQVLIELPNGRRATLRRVVASDGTEYGVVAEDGEEVSDDVLKRVVAQIPGKPGF